MYYLRFEALGDAVAGEADLVGASSGLVGLAGGAVDADYGREHDEEVEIARKERVQVARAGDFGG